MRNFAGSDFAGCAEFSSWPRCRSRAPVQTGHHSTISGHLGLISMPVGRKLPWDVAREQIVGDCAAPN